MDQTTINELAKAIAAYLSQQGFSLPLSDYLWIVFLALVSGAIGSFFGSLLKETGKGLAERLHFDRLLRQLRASEQVKTGVEGEEWKRREWSTLRRQKLEELVTKLQEASSHLSEMQWTAYAGKFLKAEGSIERANMIVIL